MTNLILNAIDAMPDGGTLSISTRRAEDAGVTVTVADTGVGIPEAVSRRIFEPFFSTKGEGGARRSWWTTIPRSWPRSPSCCGASAT